MINRKFSLKSDHYRSSLTNFINPRTQWWRNPTPIVIAHGRGCSTTAKLDVLGRRTWPLFCYHHHRWWTENIWSVEKEEGTNIWRRKIFGQRKKWRKRRKARLLKQGPEQEPSSPNISDKILITSTWSSGQSKAPESWARTARMSMANGAHEILLNKMDFGGGFYKLSLLRWPFASWLNICMFTFSYSCPPEV